MLSEIKVLHLETTDACQASCPQCLRETDQYFDHSQTHHLSWQQLVEVVPMQTLAKLDKVFACGNYGDPAAGRHTFDIFTRLRTINPSITLGVNTNGALQNHDWWTALARCLNGLQDYVIFSIDGLEDTNHIYRRGVSWHRLMANVQSFIEAGGRAHWDMLVYQHNQHQIDACEQMARKLGFKWFRAKASKRALVGNLKFPDKWHPPRPPGLPIKCAAIAEQSMYIDARGRTHPCCWLGMCNNKMSSLDEVAHTWESKNPNPVCLSSCGTAEARTHFENQWRRVVELIN